MYIQARILHKKPSLKPGTSSPDLNGKLALACNASQHSARGDALPTANRLRISLTRFRAIAPEADRVEAGIWKGFMQVSTMPAPDLRASASAWWAAHQAFRDVRFPLLYS